MFVISQLTRDGVEGLAAAIAARAVFDWIYEPPAAKAYVEYMDSAVATLEESDPDAFRAVAQECDADAFFGSIRGEVLSFWGGEWGRYLRDYFELDWLDIRDITQ